jgi:hypothetical protein
VLWSREGTGGRTRELGCKGEHRRSQLIGRRGTQNAPVALVQDDGRSDRRGGEEQLPQATVKVDGLPWYVWYEKVHGKQSEAFRGDQK